MAAHSSILAWEIPWTEESSGLTHSLRVRKGLDKLACMRLNINCTLLLLLFSC